MRWTNYLIPTLKEDPSEADTISQKLMFRSGMIRKLSSGVYNYLPIGFRTLNKVIHIVREEMDRAGAMEILMPVLQPCELWHESGRMDAFGPLMCKFEDRTGKTVILGPTHEEVVTNIVHNEISSYKQLPINLYQIQTKFRDEIRPRFGVIRSKEFIMKDAYSFDTSLEGLDKSFNAMHSAYCRIFDRCGLKYRIVEADSGLMGGSASMEFMVPAGSGEDLLVICGSCSYGANLEKAECVDEPDTDSTPEGALKEVPTPGKSTIESLSGFLGVPAHKMVKTMVFIADGKPVAVLVRGDREVNQTKLARVLNTANIALADKDAIQKHTGGPIGFTGPIGLKMEVIADNSLKGMRNFVVGANKLDAHMVNANMGRDFNPARWADVRVAVEGDKCAKCGGKYTILHGIEIGHIFKLGTKYSQKLGATYLDEKGESKPAIMGCYGIGINRIIACALEISYDNNGIIWPLNIAPFKVIISAINPKNEEIFKAAQKLHDDLEAQGIETLFDDRDASAGFKFKDADLIGIPVRVTVGTRTVKEGTVDVKLRISTEQRSVKLADAAGMMKGYLEEYASLMEAERKKA